MKTIANNAIAGVMFLFNGDDSQPHDSQPYFVLTTESIV